MWSDSTPFLAPFLSTFLTVLSLIGRGLRVNPCPESGPFWTIIDAYPPMTHKVVKYGPISDTLLDTVKPDWAWLACRTRHKTGPISAHIWYTSGRHLAHVWHTSDTHSNEKHWQSRPVTDTFFAIPCT